ncbi:MAG: FAD-dependent oxidoreductase [Chromatiales bacterium]|nr:FAD-dependent oxidoreductase [Chromatiales bacterium]
MSGRRVLLLVAIAAAIAAYFAADAGRFLSLDFVRAQQAALEGYVAASPFAAGAAFMLVYVAVTALSIPGAAVLTLAAGALFGLGWGLVLVSFASSIGATLAFLTSRFLLRDAVQARFGDRLAAVNRGIDMEGAFYLFTLRLVPVFPFFVINLLMGLTSMKTRTFYWVSQLGMLLGTAAYVNAGTELARITSLRGILSPGVLLAFALLGILPLASRRIIDAVRTRRVYARWRDRKPRHFDRNVVVIGAGSGGLVTSYIAAAVRAKVTLVERHRMGGDCLYTGCVPSKALIRSAKLLNHISRAKEFGIAEASARWDFADVMERVRRVITEIEPHDSVERYSRLGVDCVQGTARIITPWEVEIARADGTTQRLTTRNIIIATGARPLVPPIPGLAESNPLTSDTVWNLRQLPRRLVVLGGGPIGCELAQCFARFGSAVTQVQRGPRLLPREDPDVSAAVQARFESEGLRVLTGTTATRVVRENGGKFLLVEGPGGPERLPFDEILCAVGRVANTTDFGLEELGIPAGRFVEVNGHLQTNYPNIYACGDVAGPFQFTHTAAHMAWYAAVNSLFGALRKFRVDYRVVPWTTFTDPEVARVGLSEEEARAQDVPHDVHRYGIDDLDRAIADGEAHGFVKVLTKPGTDRILGATIVGEHAGDLLIEFVAAMKHGFGLDGILGTIHTYPTLAEANKYAAGAWKRTTATEGKLAVAGAFHAWTRGDAGIGRVIDRAIALAVSPDRTPVYPPESRDR